MEYPRLPDGQDKRKKLSDSQIKQILQLREEGWSFRRIAEKYQVSKTTVAYHCADQKKKDEINKERYRLLKQQEESDPDFLEQRKRRKKEDNAELLKRSPEKREYKGKMTYKWKKKKYHTDSDFQEKTRKQARAAYQRKKEKRSREKI